VRNFNLENEINKIKIPIPLVKLAKNPMYRNQIAKMISFSENEIQVDVINLEDDNPNMSYDELRTYDTTIIEHKIPLKPGVKHFKKKLR
jgi:hypothetical protein